MGLEVAIVTVCRTLEEVLAAADKAAAEMPPLSQAQADLAAILASSRPASATAARPAPVAGRDAS